MTESDLLYYSPGRLISLWRVILLVSRYEEENIKIKNVVYVVNQLGILGGTIPVKSSIRLAQRCKLLEINSGFVKLTSYCRKLVEGLGDDSEPSIEVLRFLIKTIITHNRFHWLMFFNENADIFKAAIPKEWIDLLESVNLFRLSDESVVDWWKDILGRFYEYNAGRHKEIGDVGEKLTVDYERQRLEADNFPNTFSYVKWVAHFTDSEGYDVLSARGSLLANQYQENAPIYIEVKSSVSSSSDQFRFRVSRNEWNTAVKSLESYFFYCWLGIDVQAGTAAIGPFIIPAENLEPQFPRDQSEVCEWSECRFVVDLNNFSLFSHLVV